MRTNNNEKKHKSKYIHVPSILKATNSYTSDTQNFLSYLWKKCDSPFTGNFLEYFENKRPQISHKEFNTNTSLSIVRRKCHYIYS